MPGDSLSVTGLTPEEARERLVQNAIRLHREGFIITLMWHACPPGSGDCCDGDRIWTWDRRPSQEEWDELVTDGTVLNGAWKKHADAIARYLNRLQDAQVPVLWRPFHEMNGVWFWWCNKPGENGFKRLWRMMYDYFVHHHRLNNLIWVWNTNAPRSTPGDEAGPYADFWPGNGFVDVLAADVYHGDWKQSHHDDLLKLAGGKPIALGEVGDVPSPEVLSSQTNWTWFMPWFSGMYRPGRGDAVKKTYALKQVLTKEDVRIDENGAYRIVRRNE
jgi:mannan endo-1,4-beta-mannosidase